MPSVVSCASESDQGKNVLNTIILVIKTYFTLPWRLYSLFFFIIIIIIICLHLLLILFKQTKIQVPVQMGLNVVFSEIINNTAKNRGVNDEIILIYRLKSWWNIQWRKFLKKVVR